MVTTRSACKRKKPDVQIKYTFRVSAAASATTTESKKPDVSSSTNQVKDAQTHQAQLPIPHDLYDAIKKADDIRKSLRTDKNNYDLKETSDRTEKRINLLAVCYVQTHELPRGWNYDHNTTIDAYVAKPPTPPKKKAKITRLSTINGTALTEEELKVWTNFTQMNSKVKARSYVSTLDKYLIQVEETDPVVKFIVDFAVDAFNDSYHKYVKQEHTSKNITEAVPLVCEYYKMTSKYCFYVTLDAIEQGKPGLYKAAVDCDSGIGARTLCEFALTNHKTKSKRSYNQVSFPFDKDVRSFDQEFEYEKAWLSDESEPEDFYDISGMVHRVATVGGGFNYQNPSSCLHRYILNDGGNPMYRGVKV